MDNYFDQFDADLDQNPVRPARQSRLANGQLVAGNIDLNKRPIVRNADGSISTVRSMSANFDGQEVLIPTVSDDGRVLSDDDAVELFRRTGRHLGKFSTPESATAYAQSLHNDQANQYLPKAGGNPFDALDEAPGLELNIVGGTRESALKRPDGSLTEKGWEAERRALADRRQKEVEGQSFLGNLVAGFGRAAPTAITGVRQLVTDAWGNQLAQADRVSDSLGLPDLGRDRLGMALAGESNRLRNEVASERAATEDLRNSWGGGIGNFVGDVAITAPLGAAAIPARGAGIGRAALGAAVAGGAQGAVQPVVNDQERVTNSALGAALGGGLAAGGRALIQTAENALPQNVTARALNFFQNRANRTPFAQEGEELAQRTGIELSPGAISGARSMTGAENMARSSLFSADRAFQADEKVANQALAYINRVSDRISDQAVSPQSVGDGIQRTVRDAVQKIGQSREDVAQRQFGAIRRLVGDRPVVEYNNTREALRGIINDYADVVGGDSARIRRQAESLLADIDKQPAYTLDAARRARGFYGRAANRGANVFDDVNPDLNTRLAGRLYAAMSRDLDDAGGRIDELAGFGANMPVREGAQAVRPSELLRQANDDYRRHSQLLETVKQGPLRRLLGDEISVDDFMTVNTLPPEAVITRLGAMKPSELTQVREFMARNAPDTWQQYKRMLVDDAVTEAQTFPASAGARTLPFNAGGFIRAMGGDRPDKIERLRTIFSRSEMAEIDDALNAARRLGDKFGANFSGTGPYNEMVGALRNFTVTGLSTTAATAAGFNNIARLMANSDGRRAVIELSRLPPGSRRANDLAAYLANIAAVSRVDDSQQPQPTLPAE